MILFLKSTFSKNTVTIMMNSKFSIIESIYYQIVIFLLVILLSYEIRNTNEYFSDPLSLEFVNEKTQIFL